MLANRPSLDYLLRRTREFNQDVRARPHDLNLWVRFAEFQVRQRRGALADTD